MSKGHPRPAVHKVKPMPNAENNRGLEKAKQGEKPYRTTSSAGKKTNPMEIPTTQGFVGRRERGGKRGG